MSDRMTAAAGAVEIGPAVFTVQELSIQAEIGLLKRLRALAAQAAGPGGMYARSLRMLTWMREQGHNADRAQMVDTIARMTAAGTGVAEDAIDDYRQSPDGVAEELFFRTRKTHPEATRDELRAIINDVNALEVHIAILEAIAGPARINCLVK